MAQSLIATAKNFGTEEQCLAFLEALRWPDGLRCLRCQSDKVAKIITNETERWSDVIELPVSSRTSVVDLKFLPL